MKMWKKRRRRRRNRTFIFHTHIILFFWFGFWRYKWLFRFDFLLKIDSLRIVVKKSDLSSWLVWCGKKESAGKSLKRKKVGRKAFNSIRDGCITQQVAMDSKTEKALQMIMMMTARVWVRVRVIIWQTFSFSLNDSGLISKSPELKFCYFSWGFFLAAKSIFHPQFYIFIIKIYFFQYKKAVIFQHWFIHF